MPTSTAARSPDELAFLRTITADLSNPLPQLVYADWLEERGDPLGPLLCEFVEACQTNDSLPPDPPKLPKVWAQVLGLPLRRALRKPVKPTKANPTTANQFLVHEPAILRAMRPCVGMKVGKARPVVGTPTGISRAGGSPDLPAHVPWPLYRERGREWPMQFLFQINLRDLRGTFAEDFLPTTGLVSVFHYPLHEEPRPRVFYTPPDVPLQLTDVPDPGHWEPRWAGTEHLRIDVAHDIQFADACPLPGAVEWGPSFGKAEQNELRHEYWLSQGALASQIREPSHFLCQTWYPECCVSWATLHDTLPPGHFRLAKLASEDVPPDWGFGDGAHLHVFAVLDDAKVGDFSRVVTTEYAT